MVIPSPYNFVPVSPKVFLPPWAAQASQDVPFADGRSGWFDIEVEATTPIYVRNGGDRNKRDSQGALRFLNDPERQSFFRLPDGSFGIPGTSLKGVIRSVLEIASFGKFGPVDRKRYGVRDLHNEKLYRNHLTAGDRRNGYKPKAEAGWLEEAADGNWHIIPCDMARVEQSDLEELVPGLALGRKQPASAKYRAWQAFAQTFCVNASIGPEAYYPKHSQPLRYRKAINVSLKMSGRLMHDPTLVFTGQPQDRPARAPDRNAQKAPSGKHMEFVFFNPKLTRRLDVPQTIQEDFLFIHSKSGGGDNDELSDLKKRFWERGNPMPIFYLANGSSVVAMGLALMFRLPYRYSPANLAQAQQPDSIRRDAQDLAELVFGAVEIDSPLKGRLNFETLVAVEGTVRSAENRVLTVLNSPRPTYYPNYLQQDTDPITGEIRGDYSTYMDSMPSVRGQAPAARLRGWKRYVCRNDGFSPKPPEPSDKHGKPNLNIASPFVPLQQGASFRGRVHFHNLRPPELGAVLWALSWGNKGHLRHRLGMGKPYGFGHARIRFLEGSESLETPEPRRSDADPQALSHLTQMKSPFVQIVSWNPNACVCSDLDWTNLRNACMDAYVSEMENWCRSEGLGPWHETLQIEALLRLATPVLNAAQDWPHPLDYPPDPKSFAEFKGKKLALLPVVVPLRNRAEQRTGPTSELPVRGPAKGSSPVLEPLPDIVGQCWSASFSRECLNAGQRELWFGLKVPSAGKSILKCRGMLQNPSNPALAGTLKPGHTARLWVIGMEQNDYYRLSEQPPSSGPSESQR